MPGNFNKSPESSISRIGNFPIHPGDTTGKPRVFGKVSVLKTLFLRLFLLHQGPVPLINLFHCFPLPLWGAFLAGIGRILTKAHVTKRSRRTIQNQKGESEGGALGFATFCCSFCCFNSCFLYFVWKAWGIMATISSLLYDGSSLRSLTSLRKGREGGLCGWWEQRILGGCKRSK